MKNLTMIQVVRQLQSQGHVVDFYVRKDGGILVKNIDGMKFPSGATGNAYARSLLGVSISEARKSQLKYATRVRTKPVKVQVDDAVKEEYKRVKKIWTKAFKSKGGKPHPAGYFGWQRIKRAYKQYGKAEALRRISEAEKYATGIAYSENVRILASFIMEAGNKYGSSDLVKLSEDLVANAYTIKDEWIKPAYDELYKLNTGTSPKDVAKNVRSILRL